MPRAAAAVLRGWTISSIRLLLSGKVLFSTGHRSGSFQRFCFVVTKNQTLNLYAGSTL